MATSTDKSLAELERQAEVNRAELAQTVDELHNRVSPEAIKDDMRNYARNRGQQVLESLEERARENPLQAVAIAAGLAYPLWRFVAKAPAPLLLIGAGLAVSGRFSSPGYRSAGRSSTTNGFRDRETASVAEKPSPAAMVSAAKEKVSDLGRQLSDGVGESISAAVSKTSDATNSAKDMLRDTYRGGSEAAADAYLQTRDRLFGMIERHPFLAGGVALAVGSLVASSLPVTPQEGRLMGHTSEAIRRRTKDVAAQTLDQAKATAREVYETASSAVQEEGLSPEAVRETVRTAVEKTSDAVQQMAGGGTPAQRERTGPSSRNQTN